MGSTYFSLEEKVITLKQYIVVNEYGRELGGVKVCEIYSVAATSGLNAIVAFIKDGNRSEGSTMAYNVGWSEFGDYCARLMGCDLVMSNGSRITTVEPDVIVRQDRFPF